MTKYSSTQLLDLLHSGECLVEFTKVDGTVRTMPCTLKPELLPPAPAPKVLAEGEVAKVRKESPDVIKVWCTDKLAWRSFRIDSVISVKAQDDNKTV